MEHYLIVLGLYDEGNITAALLERMSGIGSTENIFDNMYILSTEDDQFSSSTIRDIIAGDERFYVLVLRMRQNIEAAWCLPKEKVGFINEMIKSRN